MRIDVYLVENGYAESRTKAQNLIFDNRVIVNGVAVTKPSFDTDGQNIVIKSALQYDFVGRGGYKLLAALDKFNIDVSGFVAVDIGASTGGFTDCLLKRGAKKVYAIDSGTDQLHKSLKGDSRVVSIEQFNARNLDENIIGEKADIAVMDVSFISQTLLYDAVRKVLKNNGIFISLIKPQFEVGKENLNKNGIVRNEKIRRQSVDKIIAAAENLFELVGVIDSPIEGGNGNKEFLAYFLYKN